MDKKVRLRVLFNDDAVSSAFSTGWGLSFLLEDSILFDTGERGDYLSANMKQLEIDPCRINKVVISHDHWDHTGGVKEILKQNNDLDVYCCPGFGWELKQQITASKARLIELTGFTEIDKNIFSTGQISGIYKGEEIAEQAIVIKTDKGLTVLTGCAHPGIIYILRKIKEYFSKDKIYAVLGGFHLMDMDEHILKKMADKFKQLKVLKVAPMHCSGKTAKDIFKSEYGQDYIDLKAGQAVEV